jgi:predicted ATPase/class 3 adenylate cyclase
MPRQADGVDSGSTVAGIATFLFTDVEGSTRRWEADAEGMRVALAAHDRVLRDAVDEHSGTLFKHTGDGVCARFRSPRDAVAAAIAAQRSLELPARMGIATGEAEERDGDYFGATLNRASRIMAAGHGDQILLDGSTAGLLDDVDLIDLGPRRLRDIARAVQIFQVSGPGLRAEFPPLRTLDLKLGNLRVPATGLVGREGELAKLCAALKVQRLTTLTGVGGVGKTRLALETAARCADDFPAGVWVIELAAVGDPAAVPAAVAAALGITQQPGLSLTESISAAIEGQPRLLVLDNCEHVLDEAADLVQAILERAAAVRIIATSREGLRLADEQLWPVPSLDTQDGATSHAAMLFIDRARAVAPGISLTETDDADAVADICRRLDGIPLAIELAASRIQSMTVTELRDRLGDRFRLLVGARRGQERHQTLRHAIKWSYDLLDDDEKCLLTESSVFAGGFDLAAAAAVVGGGDELATLDQLDALVRKSLIVVDQSRKQTRYTLLETIRQFADDQLVDSGNAEDCRAAHARYFAGREPDILARWDSARQGEAYDWLETELPNLRIAFRWAADHGDLDTAAAIAIYPSMIGYFGGQFEPIGWAEELIATARAANHRRLAQLYTMAARSFQTGGVESAMANAEAGLEAIDSAQFDAVPYDFDAELPGVYLISGQLERTNALLLKRITQNPDASIYPRGFLVINLVMAGAIDEAVTASETLRDVEHFTDNPALVSWGLLAYGFARHSVDAGAALKAHRRGSEIAFVTGNRLLETYHAHNLSRLAGLHGDTDEALDSARFAVSNYLESGNFSLLAQPTAVLVAYFDRVAHHEAAATLSGFAGGTPFVRDYYPEVYAAITHLRTVLGDRYDGLAAAGAAMTGVEVANYALAQIEVARARAAE